MNKWEIQSKIKDKWFVRGMILLLIFSFLGGFFFGDITHYAIPIIAALVFVICFLMYKSELADELLYSDEFKSKTSKKKIKKNKV